MDKHEIGVNAGLLWHTLDKEGELSLTELKKLTKLSDAGFYIALGWLMREDKLHLYAKGKQQLVSLIY